jgi:nucleotide-binding universal stress UspA family protein
VPVAVPVAVRPAVAPDAILGTPAQELDMARPHVLVATRGGERLLEFSANYCQRTNSIMFLLFVRQVNVTITGSIPKPRIEEDADALAAFKMASDICHKHGVQMIPIYAVSQDVAYTILDFAATYGVEALLMGVSRKGTFLRALQGDVLTAVADNLPSEIPLLIHA